jgi:NAD(P)-dependent dehydrogenase (short-subunit alcohol dehydrogenase family)
VDLGITAEAAKAAEEVAAEAGHPDCLFLNAGISQRCKAAETDLAVTERILAVDFLGAVAFARTLLPGMLAAGGGRISVTSSLVGVHGFPLRSSYAAAKHALHGYFESLYLEYRKQGIGVTMGIGGRIRTDISNYALGCDGTPTRVDDPALMNGVDKAKMARRFWRAVLRGRREVFLGGPEMISVPIRRHLPCIFFWLIDFISPR